jgi:thiol-disulfide isomerase/thioredoxin
MTVETSEKVTSADSSMAKRLRNFLIAIVGIVLVVALSLGLRSQTTIVSLGELDKQSTQFDVALTNGKPSVVEFYADWCTVCQKMAPDMGELKKEYGDKVNFVMLNVDNTKWLPEMLKYRVDGIPHFLFLGQDGKSLGQTIGDQPRIIMAGNLESLASGSALPYADKTGVVSKVEPKVVPESSKDDPRSHGSQVVN